MTRYVSTIGGHRTIIDIEPSLTSFTSSGCGVWSMDLTPLITPGEPFGDGLYLIASEIAPGRYRTTSATDDCEWAMFRGAFRPDSRSTDGTFATGRSLTVVDISDRDIGFSSSGCGEWTADLTPIVTPGEPFGGGTFLVGSEVAPGRYYATSALDSCRWAFMFDFTRTLSSTERGTLPIVDIEPSHAGFASAGCGTWSTDPGPRTEAGLTFGDGVFLVGPEVAPGRYRAVSPSDECEWRRLRRFGGSVGGRPDTYVIGFGRSFIPFVDIAPTDTGFVSTGCGTWSADLAPRIVPGRPFGAGTHLVGPEVAPGRYRASSPTEACQWWRISGFSGEYFDNGDVRWLEDITDSGYVEEGAAIAEIAPGDAAFVSYGCGEWTTDFTPRVRPGQPFGGGTFLVGSEIAPGRYRTAPQTDRTCHWRRLSGFSGFRSSHLGYQRVESGSGHAIVDIAPSDVGFSSRGCGIWSIDRGSGHLPRTSFGEGTFVVGSGVPPGRYRARSAESWCTWRRLSGFGGSEDDIIAAVSADRGFGATIVDVAASDAGFYSHGCGIWSTDLTPTRSPGGSFSDGTHLVGSEIEPGRYQASETAGCTWRRLGGFGGSERELIEFVRYGRHPGPAVVEIAPSDVGFFSFACGEVVARGCLGCRAGAGQDAARPECDAGVTAVADHPRWRRHAPRRDRHAFRALPRRFAHGRLRLGAASRRQRSGGCSRSGHHPRCPAVGRRVQHQWLRNVDQRPEPDRHAWPAVWRRDVLRRVRACTRPLPCLGPRIVPLDPLDFVCRVLPSRRCDAGEVRPGRRPRHRRHRSFR